MEQGLAVFHIYNTIVQSGYFFSLYLNRPKVKSIDSGSFINNTKEAEKLSKSDEV